MVMSAPSPPEDAFRARCSPGKTDIASCSTTDLERHGSHGTLTPSADEPNGATTIRSRRRILAYCLGCTLALAAPGLPGRAAELAGVRLPDTVQEDGTTLYLNGIGLRTYSFLHIQIYVAGLYLQHLSSDAQEILHSPEVKLLTIVFKRDVSAARGREAWRTGLQDNCQLPCHLDPSVLSHFLDAIPAMRQGEAFSFLFDQSGATVRANGKLIGTIPRPQFAEAMLASFLGQNPGSQQLKQALLGNHEADLRGKSARDLERR